MASTKNRRATKFLATLAEKQAPCAFCQRMVDVETTYGKLYRIGDIYCHYFCVLLSCCLIQRGNDQDGLFGFLYPDILAEIERSKKHKCSYCYREGANLGCSVSQCRKQFHLPCGREKQAVSLFYGNYKTFCKDHAPKQKISPTIMAKAKVRMSIHNKIKREKRMQTERMTKNVKKEIDSETDGQESVESVCVICYESVDGFPTTQTFWPPCCGRDAWFHRSCLERMALSAGVHYLKCPLCNNKNNFYKAVLQQGYYIPDRDAAWELEQNAFSDIYERPVVCSVEDCQCPMGREYDAESGAWDIFLCVLCGGAGAHAQCGRAPLVCADCEPARPPPRALRALAHVPLPSQSGNASRNRSGPVMPSRMSLRRTKGRSVLNNSSTSAVNNERCDETKSITEISRQELNLKAPKCRISEQSPLEIVENKLLSPLKLLNKDLYDRILNEKSLVLDQNVLEEVRHKFKRPKPLFVKKKIINEILERFINNISRENIKTKEPIREWNSPKKLHDKENTMEENVTNIEPKTIEESEPELNDLVVKDVEPVNENLLDEDDDSNSTFQLPSEFIADYNSDQSLPIFDTPKKLKKINIESDSIEISENDRVVNIDLIKTEGDGSLNNVSREKNDKYAFKFRPFDKEVFEKNNLDIDVETFKNQYLSEVDRQFNDSKQKNTVNDDLKSDLCDTEEPKKKRPSKRKLRSTDGVASKRRKTTKMVENNKTNERAKRKKRKSKTHLSIRDKNINLKIRFKNEELKLKISKRKRKNKKLKNSPKVLRQYVLNCMDSVISRPDYDVVPLKKHYVKTERASDNLKQTSLDHFFKIKPQRP